MSTEQAAPEPRCWICRRVRSEVFFLVVYEDLLMLCDECIDRLAVKVANARIAQAEAARAEEKD